jgi:hypothetical protein
MNKCRKCRGMTKEELTKDGLCYFCNTAYGEQEVLDNAPIEETRAEKIARSVPDFDKRFTGVMKELAEEEAPVEDWEESFDKHTKKIEDLDYEAIGNYIRSDENKLFEEYCYPENIVELDPNKVKQFIRQTLRKEKDRIVREIEGIVKKVGDTVQGDFVAEEILTKIKLIQNK